MAIRLGMNICKFACRSERHVEKDTQDNFRLHSSVLHGAEHHSGAHIQMDSRHLHSADAHKDNTEYGKR